MALYASVWDEELKYPYISAADCPDVGVLSFGPEVVLLEDIVIGLE
jgi:hypothetical protein